MVGQSSVLLKFHSLLSALSAFAIVKEFCLKQKWEASRAILSLSLVLLRL